MVHGNSRRQALDPNPLKLVHVHYTPFKVNPDFSKFESGFFLPWSKYHNVSQYQTAAAAAIAAAAAACTQASRRQLRYDKST